ncbi:hypothetical protein FCULG_00008085 [Fusarium culmorum]|uniref:LysM domain-containing protein n=1 Tax=Fusarium culmorum TaxID=5516 RepID=A0A2T4H2L2_FUSCU|nr:hypothetical protein FCULG_00008085 [Fusarium culmorum]
MESCSTCATILSSTPAYTKEELSLPQDRRVACCSRIICGKCIHVRHLSLPLSRMTAAAYFTAAGPERPPAYSSSSSTAHIPGAPPPYSAASTTQHVDAEKAALAQDDLKEDAPDILHFLDHQHDSVSSLSLRYGVPASALRRSNNITSDHLLLGRRTILIPGEYYKGGVSLSPRPIEGEDEEMRKGKIRRFMTSCKVSDYDIAVLYLEQSNYDIGNAVTAYLDDEKWEQEHSVPGKGKKADKYKNRGPFWRGL